MLAFSLIILPLLGVLPIAFRPGRGGRSGSVARRVVGGLLRVSVIIAMQFGSTLDRWQLRT